MPPERPAAIRHWSFVIFPVPDSVPNVALLSSLGRLVRGLSALFWGLPMALVVCVQTAKGEWLRPLGIVPPLAMTALLLYGVGLLGDFQKQERVWHAALDRARACALVNVGLAPFLYWWGRLPNHPFYTLMIEVMIVTGLLFFLLLNPVLWRLAAMLPDETLRLETKLFTTINRYLLFLILLLLTAYFVMVRIAPLPQPLIYLFMLMERGGLWLLTFLILLPVAMTMALIWKMKEVVLAGVFGPGR